MENLADIQNTKVQTMSERHLYIIRRNCALWQVVLKSSGKVVFSSLSKANCVDWLEANYPENESE